MRLPMISAVATLGMALAACSPGEEQVTEIEPATIAAKQKAASAPAITKIADGNNHPKQETTPSDNLWLEMATRACRAKDFKGFFRAFSGSGAVRARYTAPVVNVGETGRSMKLERARYANLKHFPLAVVDNFFVTADTERPLGKRREGPSRHRFVQVEINHSGDNRGRVDWLPGIFEIDLRSPPEEPMEGLGDLVKKTGPGGYLIFKPDRDCWQLTEDMSLSASAD